MGMELSTKEKLMGFLLRYGVDAERIHEIPKDQIEQAPPELRELFEHTLIVPYIINWQGQNALYKATVNWDENWIQVKLLLQKKANLSVGVERNLFAALLNANYNLPEVTFSLGDDGGVYIEADMPVESDYENFESEYASIEFGADHFLNTLLPKVVESIQPEPTYEE